LPTTCNRNVKFIVDRMHGDLARWLRILGYDTLYSPNLSDYRIIQIARRSRRIIITRDRGLVAWARRKGLKAYMISGIEPEEKLGEVALYTNICLKFDPDKTRCPLCNTKLTIIPKDKVKGKVPPKVYEEHEEFWFCSKCNKIYWIGSHWRDILYRLEKAKRLTSRRS
jgi:uncharacterized protein with PIN domain